MNIYKIFMGLTRRYLALIPCCLLALIATGCGGGGGSSAKSEPPPSSSASTTSNSALSSSSTATTPSGNFTSSVSSSSSVASTAPTNYKVSVNIPASFENSEGSHKGTNVSLSANNFALVSVNLSGVVIERYSLKNNDITKDKDGNWNISAPVTPRVDTVIVADVSKNIDLPTTDNINKDGLVYAPITSQEVDIDIASTSAYRNLIGELGGSGTFQSKNISPTDAATVNAVENLISNIQNAESAAAYDGKKTVAEALAVIDVPVKAIVAQEAINIKSPVPGTAVSLIRDEGGLFWYESTIYYDSSFNQVYTRGRLASNGSAEEIYTGNKFVARPADEVPKSFYYLGSSGWGLESGSSKNNVSVVESYHEDGSVNLHDANAPGKAFALSVSQSFDVSGRNILDFLASNFNTTGLVGLVNPTTQFSAGAKAYRLAYKTPESYAIYYDVGDDDGKCWGGELLASATGGNCVSVSMTADDNKWEDGVSGVNKLYSADVAPNAAGFRAVNLGSVGNNKLTAQILQDSNKTVKFYEQAWTGDYAKLLSTSTWSEITLPHIGTDNKAVHFDYPASVKSVSQLWSGDVTGESFVQQNGYLRGLQIFSASTQLDAAIHFNSAANSNIDTALNYTSALVGSWAEGGLIFLNNSQYIQAQLGDSNCPKSIEFGVYSWNPKLGKLSASTLFDGNDDCGISDATVANPVAAKIQDDKLIWDNGTYIATKTPSVANSIIGSWIYGDLQNSAYALTFTATHYLTSDFDAHGDSGLEYGTYTLDGTTGALHVSASLHTSGDGGLEDAANKVININGDTMTIQCTDCGSGLIFKRIK